LFLRAYFEERHKDKMMNYLLSKEKPQTPGERLVLQMKLERLLSIDSRHASVRGGIYYQPTALEQVLAEFKLGQSSIKTLTAQYQREHMSYAQGHFIATEIVKHREKYGVDMPTERLKSVEYVSDYVGKHYAILRKQGLDKQEAKLVYIEGANVLLEQAHKADASSITKPEIEKIQRASKQQFEGLTREVQKSAQQHVTPAITKKLEISM